MKINDIRVEYTTSQPGTFPAERFAEIAFIGRSNVGKSSLINSLVNRKKLARTSKDPGRTRAVHWYRVASDLSACHFVDLPGYGYAKVPRAVREQEWGRLISTYLRTSEKIVLALQLLDLRRDGPTDLDMQMIEWLRESAVPHTFVLTKADKIGRGKRMQAVQRFAKLLETPEDLPPIAYSSVSGEGKRALWSIIDSRIAAAASNDQGNSRAHSTVTTR